MLEQRCSKRTTGVIDQEANALLLGQTMREDLHAGGSREICDQRFTVKFVPGGKKALRTAGHQEQLPIRTNEATGQRKPNSSRATRYHCEVPVTHW